ncbi:MAG: acyl-CoA dehydrogenase family protein [Halovenus sp.]
MSRLETLSGEAKLIADTVDDIAEEYDHEYWLECAKADERPVELWETLCEQGFVGVNIPEEYGGTAFDMYGTSIFLERLASHGIYLGDLIPTAVMGPIAIREHAPEALKERLLPAIAAGDLKLSYGITEPDSGTNTYKIRTTIERDGDEYVINGQKTFVTNFADTDYIQLVGRTTPYEAVKDDDKRKGITSVIVPTDANGISYDPLDLDMTQTDEEYSVHFDDVRAPVDNRLGDEDEAFHQLFSSLNPERIAVSAIVLGLGRFALERGVDYAKEREVWDVPIGSHQGVQHPLARAKVDLELATLATDRAAEAVDANNDLAGPLSNVAKLAASEAADQAVDTAIQVHGGNGFSRHYGVINVADWVRHMRVAPVNNEVVLSYIATNVLGLPRSY